VDSRTRSVGRGVGSGIGNILARNQEVPEGGSPREPIHHGGAGLCGGGSEVARGRDAYRLGCIPWRSKQWGPALWSA